MRSDRHGDKGKHPDHGHGHKDHPHPDHDDDDDGDTPVATGNATGPAAATGAAPADVKPVEANPGMAAGKADATFSGGSAVPEAQIADKPAQAPMTPEANVATGPGTPEPPMVPTDTKDEGGGVVAAGAGGALHDQVVEAAGAADEEKPPQPEGT